MKKKLLVIMALLVMGTAVELSALGIGVQGNSDAIRGGWGGSITFASDGVHDRQWIFAGNIWLGNSLTVWLTGDRWFLNENLIGPVDGFVGGGLYGKLWLGDPLGFGGGARLPVGLRLVIKDFFEIYGQVAAQAGVRVLANHDLFEFEIPVAIGLRVWF